MREPGYQKKGNTGWGDLDQDSGMRMNTGGDIGVTQRYDSCGYRPHSHQPKVMLTRRLIGNILQQWFRSPPPSSKR
ncbi:unnamed protein product [Strongylus vulgaris]|uniref:Uncharacterized protein n=1 Tax=Strongylus vulgaris TaxID=40348 RepID=A0A3P7JRY3_STRVU|nr:unnamed protein product [Strongylus vulgaris]